MEIYLHTIILSYCKYFKISPATPYINSIMAMNNKMQQVIKRKVGQFQM